MLVKLPFTSLYKPLKSLDKPLEEFIFRRILMEKKKAGGKPFRSKLEPYCEAISAARRQRQTWVEISLELKDKYGVDCTAQGIHSFFKTRVKGRVPLGFEPTPARSATLTDPPTNSIGEKNGTRGV